MHAFQGIYEKTKFKLYRQQIVSSFIIRQPVSCERKLYLIKKEEENLRTKAELSAIF